SYDNVNVASAVQKSGTLKIRFDILDICVNLVPYLRLLPRFLPTQRRPCIVALGFLYRPAMPVEQVENRRHEGKSHHHASCYPRGHYQSQAANAPVFGQNETSETCDRGQTR